MKVFVFFIFSLFVFSQNACTYNKFEEIAQPNGNTDSTACDTCKITYQNSIKFLVERTCAEGKNGDKSCHFSPNLGSRDFSTYQGLVASSYYKNKLLPAVQHQSGTVPMPFNNPKLPQADIDTIKMWVDKGFLEN